MLILTVKGYELPVCWSLAQGQAVIELMKTLMYQNVDDWHQCASWRKCWGTLVHSKWQCPETQFTTLHLLRASVAISSSVYCLHQQCQNTWYTVLNFYMPITREFFCGMVCDELPKAIILRIWLCLEILFFNIIQSVLKVWKQIIVKSLWVEESIKL